MTVTSTPARARGALGLHFRQTNILRAAAVVFAKKGVNGATVEDLLQEAGVARRTFYRLFRSKEEVLVALFDVSCNILLEAIRKAVINAKEPFEKLERAVDVYLGFHRETSALLRVLEAEALRPGSLLAARRLEMLDAGSRELAGYWTTPDGRSVDPLLMHGVLVALEGVSHRMHAEGTPSEERLQQARRAMLRIVTASLARPGDPVAPLPLA